MVIQWSHRDSSKPCCGKDYSKSQYETYLQRSLGNENKKAREIQCFELGIFSFNSYVYYPTRDFNFRTRVFSVLAREFELVTAGFELVICGFELATRRVKLATCGFKLATREFELVTRVLLCQTPILIIF